MSRGTCPRTGKKGYLKGEAFSIAELRNRYKGNNGTAYDCPHCNWWHVTKKPKPWPLDKLNNKEKK